jgi:hypothetical protein
VEVSLVDRPCNPTCTIDISKAYGAGGLGAVPAVEASRYFIDKAAQRRQWDLDSRERELVARERNLQHVALQMAARPQMLTKAASAGSGGPQIMRTGPTQAPAVHWEQSERQKVRARYERAAAAGDRYLAEGYKARLDQMRG